MFHFRLNVDFFVFENQYFQCESTMKRHSAKKCLHNGDADEKFSEHGLLIKTRLVKKLIESVFEIDQLNLINLLLIKMQMIKTQWIKEHLIKMQLIKV